MVRYECDNCRRLKEKNEEWILGFAAENIGVTAARREITFLSKWDEAQAVDWLAVHFCSAPCKQDYMSRLFGDTVPSDVITEVAVMPVKKREVRVISGGKTDTTSRSRKSAPHSRHKSASRKHKSA
jgi:hypothetical protein